MILAQTTATAALAISIVAQVFHPGAEAPPTRALEIRTYTLKTGTRDRFHDLVVRTSLPLLEKWKVDVVAYGPSRHDDDSYFLMRAFPDVATRDRVETAFYGSPEWLSGPRADILALIDTYTTVVVYADEATLAGLRRSMHTARENTLSDLDELVRLNADYIEAVKASDVDGFREILAEDFLCTLPDGSAGAGRYTDVWAKREGIWVAVAAHVTRS